MASDSHWAAALKLATSPSAALSARQGHFSQNLSDLLPAPSSSRTTASSGSGPCDDEQHALRMLTFAENRATIKRLEAELKTVLAVQAEKRSGIDAPSMAVLLGAPAPNEIDIVKLAALGRLEDAWGKLESQRKVAGVAVDTAAPEEPKQEQAAGDSRGEKYLTPRQVSQQLEAAGDAARLAERALMEMAHTAAPAPPMPPPILPAAWCATDSSVDEQSPTTFTISPSSRSSTSRASDTPSDRRRPGVLGPLLTAAEEAGGSPLAAKAAERRRWPRSETVGMQGLAAALSATGYPAQSGGLGLQNLGAPYRAPPAPPTPPVPLPVLATEY